MTKALVLKSCVVRILPRGELYSRKDHFRVKAFKTFLELLLMRLYYYICPRCGLQWTRLLPHSTMKCQFCETTWETKGKKGTRSHFSIFATIYWLFLVAIIVSAIVFHRSIFDYIVDQGARSIDSQASLEAEQETPSEPNLQPLEETTPVSGAEEQANNR